MNQQTSPPILSLPLERIVFSSVTLDDKGAILEQTQREAWIYSQSLDRGLSLDLVFVPGGTYQMGSLHERGYSDEQPRHLVSTAPFMLGRFLVTQAQWQVVMYSAARGRFSGADLPVDNVSFQDAHAFCERLRKLSGHAYQLPSEAQWEYACRGGGQSAFSTGLTITTDYANYVGLHIYLNEPQGIYRHTTTPAGAFPANPYGLLDMHGNLWEYCADRWHEDYSSAPFDDTPWQHGGESGYRTARGGSWHEPPINCRCAARLKVNETERDDFYGFRVALPLP